MQRREQLIRQVGGFLSNRTAEIILGALFTVAIAICGISIRASATLQESVTENKVAIARNQERIEAACERAILRDVKIAERIHDLMERLDQRCDTLENLISLLYETRDTGG